MLSCDADAPRKGSSNRIKTTAKQTVVCRILFRARVLHRFLVCSVCDTRFPVCYLGHHPVLWWKFVRLAPVFVFRSVFRFG